MSVKLSDEDKSLLEGWLAKKTLPQRQASRARIILELASGSSVVSTASKLGVNREMVTRWKKRYAELGVKGLEEDAPRPGRPRTIPEDRVKAVLTITRLTTPDAATHWTVRTMAKTAGVSPASVQRIWAANGMKPHLIRTFKLSKDPNFEQKLIDVAGLYLNPPEKAMVVCVDEKPQIQALDRTQPGLPMKKGRCGTMTHDYKRNGTTILFAALNVTNKAIRRGCFYSVDELVETIDHYLKVNNAEPKPFKWTASAESIIEKVNRCRDIYETLH